MKITHIGYFGPTTNLRAPRIGVLDTDQLAAAIAALPPRKPLGASASAERLVQGGGARFQLKLVESGE